MVEEDVAGDGTEEGNTPADEDGDTGDDEAVDEARGEEALDGDAAVDVGVFESAGAELADNFGGCAGHLVDDPVFDPGEILRLGAEDHDGLFAIEPLAVAHDELVGSAAEDDDVDGGVELLQTMRLVTAGVEEVDGVIEAGQKAVDADATKDGKLHGAFSQSCEQPAEEVYMGTRLRPGGSRA